MSAKITGQVWDLQLPRMEIHILLAMADHAHHDGTHVFPSQALIAWKTGYSIRQIRRVQESLKHQKILIPEGSGYRGVQHYRLDFSQVPLKPPFVTRDTMSSEDKMSAVKKPHVNKSLRSTTDKMSSVEPTTTDKMSSVTTTDKMSSEDIYDTTTDIFDTLPIKDARAEPLVEPKEEKEIPPENANAFSSPTPIDVGHERVPEKKVRKPRKLKDLPTYDPEGYERFIAEYPSRNDLDEAVKAWDWLKPDAELQQTLLADIQVRKERHQKWADGFICYPATYLRGRRWRDEIITPNNARASPDSKAQRAAEMQDWVKRKREREDARKAKEASP